MCAGDVIRLEVVLRWRYNAALDYLVEPCAHPDREPNELRVAIIRAKGLPAMDKPLFGGGAGASDPVVTLRLGRQSRKTSVRKATLEVGCGCGEPV